MLRGHKGARWATIPASKRLSFGLLTDQSRGSYLVNERVFNGAHGCETFIGHVGHSNHECLDGRQCIVGDESNFSFVFSSLMQGSYKAAEQLYRRSLNILETTNRAKHPDVSSCLTKIAKLLSKQLRALVSPSDFDCVFNGQYIHLGT